MEPSRLEPIEVNETWDRLTRNPSNGRDKVDDIESLALLEDARQTIEAWPIPV